MEIKYLKQLADHPAINFLDSNNPEVLKPLSETEVALLENNYNNRNQFPGALRELLLLAGKDCYVFDYGRHDSLVLQNSVRNSLTEYSRSMDRPFFAIDVYGGNSLFMFVYLDEGNAPGVYQVDLEEEDHTWIRGLGLTLSSLINNSVIKMLKGISPF